MTRTGSLANTPAYPIRVVARMTGLSLDTIRAWERRYEAVVPRRNKRGRVYSESQVARLRLLAELVKRGHAIGTIAQRLGQDAEGHFADRQLHAVSHHDQVSPAPERGDQIAHEPGLAHPSRPHQRDDLPGLQELGQGRQLLLAPDERVAVDRRQPPLDGVLGAEGGRARGFAFGDDLADPLVLVEALQPVGPPIDDLEPQPR